MTTILCLGAASIDIIGVSASALIPKDSNPGSVQIAVGGVATNIALNLTRLGLKPTLVSVQAEGMFAAAIQAELLQSGLDLSRFVKTNRQAPLFVGLHQVDGALEAAINDFQAMDDLTPERVFDALADLPHFDIAVLDANLPAETIDAFLKRYPTTKIFADGVSRTKVLKFIPHLSRIDLLKINRHELGALLGRAADDVILSARELLNRGVKQMLITNGGEPISYNIGRSIYQTVVFEADHKVSTLGCGDALFAGTIYGLLQGKTMHEAVNYGKKAASLTMEVVGATNPSLRRELIENDR
jgi:pseudouridine kinase